MSNNNIDTELLFAVMKNKSLSELTEMWRNANRKRARGDSILGGSFAHDEEFLWNLNRLIREKEAEAARAPLTEEQRFNDEVEQLSRQHHVGEKYARNYLERHRQAKREPFDALRKDRRPAPDPQPLEAPLERSEDEPEDMRPYRLCGRGNER
jgi:hypothetical protein